MRKKMTIAKILKLKDNRKKEIEIEVKKAQDKVDEENSKLSELKEVYENCCEEFEGIIYNGTCNASSLSAYHDFFSNANNKIKQQKKNKETSQNELNIVNEKLISAHKEKKAFEILNEKATKTEKHEKLASEQKETDFIAITRRNK